MTPFHPRHLHLLRQVTGLTWHPGGHELTLVVSWADADTDDNRSQLHRLELDGTISPLTTAHRAWAPAWSPDGTRLAYLAVSEPGATPVVRCLGGGEPDEWSLPDGFSELAWWGDQLFALAPRRPAEQEGVDEAELARRPRVIDTFAYRAEGRGWIHDRSVQLHRLEPDGAVTPLTEGAELSSLVVSDDRLLAARRIEDTSGRTEVVELDADGRATVLTRGPGSWVPVGVLDGEVMVLGRSVDEVGPRRLHRVGADGMPELTDPDEVNRSVLIGAELSCQVVGSSVLAPAVRDGAVHLDRLESGRRQTLIGGERVVVAADGHPGGAVAAAVASLDSPAELVLVDAAGERTLTQLGRPFLDAVELAPVRRVEVGSTEGAMVTAWLVEPSDPCGAGLVYVHGGPYAQYTSTIFDEVQVAASCGYTVIHGNPRGSDGRGTEWGRAICGRLGGPDLDDVMALADHLAAHPAVDPERIGIGGGSYGGWMSATAITRTDRFRAALVERPVTNWETFVSTSDIGVWFAGWYLDPGDPEALRAASPVQHLDRVSTPVLIIHSEKDWRCPIEQAEQLFVGLKRRGIEVTLARFPDEGHELSRSGKPSRRRDRFELIHDFYATHLGGRRIADLGAT